MPKVPPSEYPNRYIFSGSISGFFAAYRGRAGVFDHAAQLGPVGIAVVKTPGLGDAGAKADLVEGEHGISGLYQGQDGT